MVLRVLDFRSVQGGLRVDRLTNSATADAVFNCMLRSQMLECILRTDVLIKLHLERRRWEQEICQISYIISDQAVTNGTKNYISHESEINSRYKYGTSQNLEFQLDQKARDIWMQNYLYYIHITTQFIITNSQNTLFQSSPSVKVVCLFANPHVMEAL